MYGRKATSFLHTPQTLCPPGANRPKSLHSGDGPGDAGQRIHEKKSFPAHWQEEEPVMECHCFPAAWHLCGLFPRVSRQELSCIDTCVGTYVIDTEECVCMYACRYPKALQSNIPFCRGHKLRQVQPCVQVPTANTWPVFSQVCSVPNLIHVAKNSSAGAGSRVSFSVLVLWSQQLRVPGSSCLFSHTLNLPPHRCGAPGNTFHPKASM